MSISLYRKPGAIAVGVMSHGDETGILMSNGQQVPISAIVDWFAKDYLRGVPKVFIIQACRYGLFVQCYFVGSTLQILLRRGERRQLDTKVTDATCLSPTAGMPSPRARGTLYSDCVLAHSTMPEHVAFRHREDGSPFVQIACRVFRERAHTDDLQTLFNSVQRQALNFILL